MGQRGVPPTPRPRAGQWPVAPLSPACAPVSSAGPAVGWFARGALPPTGRAPPREADPLSRGCGRRRGVCPSVPASGRRLHGAPVLPTQRRTARKAGPRGRSGQSAPPPAGPAPSREAGPATSPATPAWARPSRRGRAAWASVTTAVSVRPLGRPRGVGRRCLLPSVRGPAGSPGVQPGWRPSADGRVPVC